MKASSSLVISSFKIVAVCAASFVVATAVAWSVFDAMPHLEDEHVNYFQAKVFAQGRVTNPEPPVPDAFRVPWVITVEGRQFGRYPPGYPLLLAIGIRLGQPWLVTSLAAALGILGTYLLGRDLFNRETGLLAAALGAVSPMYVMLSGTLLSHPTSLATLVFFAWTFLRAREPAEPHRYAFAWAAGALGGLALINRPWTAFGIGLPFAVFALVDLARRRGPAVAIYGPMVAAFVAVSALWPLYNLVATGSPLTNTHNMLWPYDSIGFGPQIGNPPGYSWAHAVLSLRISLAMFHTVVTGWPVLFGVPLVWLVIGMGIVLPPHSRFEPMLLIPASTLVVAYLAYWVCSAGVYGPRFYAEAMPFLWLLAARGLLKASSWEIGRRVVKIALPLCVVWGILFSTYPRFLDAKGLYGISRDDAKRIAKAGIHNALIIVQGDDWTDYANLSWLNAADLQTGDNIFARDRGVSVNQLVVQYFPNRAVYYYDRHRSDPLVPAIAGPSGR